ncbi:hypothetical protein L9F63_022552 [Diploptera punctata]|uniref:G-protein coupled receptors family 1 profile domain-containing protein n=1 Tax=Diploptera punctata TaxID=6984 RepID=A0AAD8EAV6_DIPPU|nr:hypothetical protein L9F63_022552 [Diploptera punctata]
MNLAVSDFLLMSKMPVFVYNSLYQGPMLGEIGCQIYGFVGGLTGTVSITTLAAISLDRYYVIVYPLDPIRKTTRCRARFSVIFAWCYGGVFSLLPLLKIGIGSYVPEGYLTSCSYDYLDFSFNNRLFILIFFLAAWFVPFCVILVCYVGICRVVMVTRNVKNVVGGESSRHEKNRSEIRLAGVVIGIIALWFAAWTPYAVVSLIGIAGKKEYITPLSSMIPALFCKIASCIDPYVYAVTHPKFRLEVTSLVRRVSLKSNFKSEKNRSSRAWNTQCEMSETCKIQGPRRSRQSSDDFSDVEEMVVVIDSNVEKKKSISSSEETQVFPTTTGENVKLQPPTWFVPPKPHHDKRTSFKRKSLSKQENK